MFPETTPLTSPELASAIVRDPLVVSPTTTAIDAIAQMSGVRSRCHSTQKDEQSLDNLHSEARSSCVLVVEADRVVGIFTERDVVRLSAGEHPLHRPLRDVMSRPPVTLSESALTDLFFAVNFLARHRIRHLPILDDRDRLAGLVTHETLCHTTRPIDLLRLRRVSEVMAGDVVRAGCDRSVLDIARLMADRRVSSVVLVEPGQSPPAAVGLLTERDLVQFQALGLTLKDYRAEMVMSAPVFSVTPEETLWTVQQMMQQHLIRRLVVAGETGELLGIVTQTSLLQALNPLELYKLAQDLETKVACLEAEKVALLENRAAELEREVAARTAALEAKAERERLLADLAVQIRSSLSLQEVLETTVEQVRRVLDCDRVTIWQFEAEWCSVVVAESTDSPVSLMGERIDDTCFGHRMAEVYRQGNIRLVDDIEAIEMSECHRQMLVRLETRAKILVPLLCGDRLWGLLNVTESQPRKWEPEEVELLRSLSVQLAIALQQATTYQQLQASERRYMSLADAVPVGLFRTDIQGNCLYVNERWCQMAGLSPKAAMGRGWWRCLHPDDRDRLLARWQRFVRHHQPDRLEIRLQHPDGTVRWVDVQFVVERDANGAAIGYVGTIADITDRKQAELALHNLIEGTAATTEKDFFPALARYIAEALEVSYTVVAEAIDGELQTLAVWASGALQPNFTHRQAQTPCERTLREGKFYCETGLQEQFPDDCNLVKMEAKSYLGVALRDSQGRAIGNLCVLSKQSIKNPERAEQLLRVFGARAAAELERQRASTALTQLNQELEERVQQRTAQLRDREALLKIVSERLELALRSVEMGIWDWDIVRDRLIWNDRMYELYDIDPAQFPGAVRGWQEKLHPDDAADTTQLLQQALRGEKSFDAQFRVIHNDGRIRWIQAHALVQQDDRGQPQRAIGTNVDITEYKEANQQRQQLIQELSDFKSALDESAIVVITDAKGVITYTNDRFCEVSGYSREQLLGNTHQLINSGYHTTEFFQGMWQTISSGQIWRGEICNRAQNGKLYWVDSTIVPFLDASGQPFQYLTIRFEISDRKQTEAAMKQQLVAIEAAINGIAILQNGHYVYLNRAHLEMFGYDRPEELVGQSWELLYSQTEIQRFQREVFPCLERDRVWQGEAVSLRKDGSSFSEEVSLTLTDNGLMICVCQDISDRKRSEKIIRRQARQEKLLGEITRRIRQSLDLQTIFDTACQEIQQAIKADRVGIFKFYPESNFDDGEFVAEANQGGLPSVLAKRVRDRCFGENFSALYMQGKFYAIDDIYSNGLTSCHSDILAQFQVRANLVMPLLYGEQLWGLLCVHQCTDTRHWQQSEIELVQRLSGQLALAIQQASLYDRVQSELLVRQQAEAQIALQLRQQQALGAIVQRIRESLDIDQILFTAAQHVKDILKSDRVIVFRLFPDGRSCIVEEAVSPEFINLKDRHWEDEVWSPDILECYWQGQPRIVPDVMQDIWTDCLVEYSLEGQIQSKIVAPILQEVRVSENHRWVAPGETNKLWGVLVVHACKEKRVWHKSEAQLLQQIANQLAIAIQQASLFEQLQQELKERQQAQQQLTQRNQELIRATRLKDEFLANMSHELRTPLNAILGMSEALQEEVFGQIEPRQSKALQTIERSGSHLLALINDILDVAKIESGQIQLEFAPTAIAPLCESTLAFIKQQAVKKQIQLDLKVPTNLPDLFLDERCIRQVLLNLLNNAVKFTPNGGKIILEVTYDPATRSDLRMAVIDTGIGIAPENISKLFQPFIQIDSALNRQYTGTGLGLALVKRIVELHGGEVGLTSQLGVGSCFTIDLPCTPSALSINESPMSPETTLEPTLENTPSPLILLAEDNEANVETISSYLEVKGYRLLVAENGEEAIATARSHPPDLILMDIQMPKMDGLEAIQTIRRDPNLAEVPIVALTALAMSGDRDRCLAAGADDYLSKPVKLKELTRIIQDLLTPHSQ